MSHSSPHDSVGSRFSASFIIIGFLLVLDYFQKIRKMYKNDIYANQKEFVDRAIDLLDSKGKAAVVLPTGVGKSYIAADVIRHYLNCLVP